jgi:hypothetical protein
MRTILGHTYNQIQALDVGLSACHMSESRRAHACLDSNARAPKSIRTPCGFQKAATPIKGSSHSVGRESYININETGRSMPDGPESTRGRPVQAATQEEDPDAAASRTWIGKSDVDVAERKLIRGIGENRN